MLHAERPIDVPHLYSSAVRRLRVLTALVAVVSLTAGCARDQMRDVTIIGGMVQEKQLTVHLGICQGEENTIAELTETKDSVNVRVQTRRRSRGGDELACSDGLVVPLHAPLGDRTLVDASTRKQVDVQAVPGT